MHKLGLKLWSINTESYISEAQNLFDNRVYDYIELYAVPDSLDTIEKWKALSAPFIIHAPHYRHGVNLSKSEYLKKNIQVLSQARKFADELNAEHIIIHGGIDGDIKETTRQLLKFNDSRTILENKPRIIEHFKGDFCIGSTVEEIKYFLENTHYGFCLDIGHAVAAAATFKIDPYGFVGEFLKLNPEVIHLSDTHLAAQTDEHLNFGQGDLDIARVVSMLTPGSLITIETNKTSKHKLDDFVEDVEYLNSLIWRLTK